MKGIDKKLRSVSSTKEKNILELDENMQRELNIKMVIALFETIYRQNIITKKQYDKLIANAYRTYYFNK